VVLTKCAAVVLCLLLGEYNNALALDPGRAEKRAQSIQHYHDTLNAALAAHDKTRALVFIEEGLKSDDPQIARIAFESALKDEDKDIKDLAIRHWWSKRKHFLVRFVSPDSPDKTLAAFLKSTPNFQVTDMSIDENGGITARGYRGNFTNGGFELTQYIRPCTLVINDVTPKVMAGTYTCPRLTPLAARIELE